MLNSLRNISTIKKGWILLNEFFILNISISLQFSNLIHCGKFDFLIDFYLLLLLYTNPNDLFLLSNRPIILVTLIHITNNYKQKYTKHQPIIINYLLSYLSGVLGTKKQQSQQFLYFYPMMNRMAFSNYQSMNVVHRTKDGNQLWLGDYYAASNVNLLKQKSIRSVLTSAAMLGINYPKQHNINHKTINAFDIPSYKMTPHFEDAFRFIDDALKKGNLLVHCAAGISRSTTFVLVYLMRGQNMAFKQAMDYVRSKRPIICPNHGFQSQLKRLEINLKKGGKQQKEQTFSNYSNFSQKKAVLDFLNEDKKSPVKKQDKLSSTVSGYKPQYGNESYVGNLGGTDNNGFLRGKSVNYTNKKSIDRSTDMKSLNKYSQKYDSFKVGQPKIVTIKK